MVVNLKINLIFKTYQKPHHALVFQSKNVNLCACLRKGDFIVVDC